MTKLFYRTIGLLLVPCLVADPATASAFQPSTLPISGLTFCENYFTQEALAASPVASMPRAPEGDTVYRDLHKSRKPYPTPGESMFNPFPSVNEEKGQILNQFEALGITVEGWTDTSVSYLAATLTLLKDILGEKTGKEILGISTVRFEPWYRHPEVITERVLGPYGEEKGDTMTLVAHWGANAFMRQLADKLAFRLVALHPESVARLSSNDWVSTLNKPARVGRIFRDALIALSATAVMVYLPFTRGMKLSMAMFVIAASWGIWLALSHVQGKLVWRLGRWAKGNSIEIFDATDQGSLLTLRSLDNPQLYASDLIANYMLYNEAFREDTRFSKAYELIQTQILPGASFTPQQPRNAFPTYVGVASVIAMQTLLLLFLTSYDWMAAQVIFWAGVIGIGQLVILALGAVLMRPNFRSAEPSARSDRKPKTYTPLLRQVTASALTIAQEVVLLTLAFFAAQQSDHPLDRLKKVMDYPVQKYTRVKYFLHEPDVDVKIRPSQYRVVPLPSDYSLLMPQDHFAESLAEARRRGLQCRVVMQPGDIPPILLPLDNARKHTPEQNQVLSQPEQSISDWPKEYILVDKEATAYRTVPDLFQASDMQVSQYEFITTFDKDIAADLDEIHITVDQAEMGNITLHTQVRNPSGPLTVDTVIKNVETDKPIVIRFQDLKSAGDGVVPSAGWIHIYASNRRTPGATRRVRFGKVEFVYKQGNGNDRPKASPLQWQSRGTIKNWWMNEGGDLNGIKLVFPAEFGTSVGNQQVYSRMSQVVPQTEPILLSDFLAKVEQDNPALHENHSQIDIYVEGRPIPTQEYPTFKLLPGTVVYLVDPQTDPQLEQSVANLTIRALHEWPAGAKTRIGGRMVDYETAAREVKKGILKNVDGQWNGLWQYPVSGGSGKEEPTAKAPGSPHDQFIDILLPYFGQSKLSVENKAKLRGIRHEVLARLLERVMEDLWPMTASAFIDLATTLARENRTLAIDSAMAAPDKETLDSLFTSQHLEDLLTRIHGNRYWPPTNREFLLNHRIPLGILEWLYQEAQSEKALTPLTLTALASHYFAMERVKGREELISLVNQPRVSASEALREVLEEATLAEQKEAAGREERERKAKRAKRLQFEALRDRFSLDNKAIEWNLGPDRLTRLASIQPGVLQYLLSDTRRLGLPVLNPAIALDLYSEFDIAAQKMGKPLNQRTDAGAKLAIHLLISLKVTELRELPSLDHLSVREEEDLAYLKGLIESHGGPLTGGETELRYLYGHVTAYLKRSGKNYKTIAELRERAASKVKDQRKAKTPANIRIVPAILFFRKQWSVEQEQANREAQVAALRQKSDWGSARLLKKEMGQSVALMRRQVQEGELSQAMVYLGEAIKLGEELNAMLRQVILGSNAQISQQAFQWQEQLDVDILQFRKLLLILPKKLVPALSSKEFLLPAQWDYVEAVSQKIIVGETVTPADVERLDALATEVSHRRGFVRLIDKLTDAGEAALLPFYNDFLEVGIRLVSDPWTLTMPSSSVHYGDRFIDILRRQSPSLIQGSEGLKDRLRTSLQSAARAGADENLLLFVVRLLEVLTPIRPAQMQSNLDGHLRELESQADTDAIILIDASDKDLKSFLFEYRKARQALNKAVVAYERFEGLAVELELPQFKVAADQRIAYLNSTLEQIKQALSDAMRPAALEEMDSVVHQVHDYNEALVALEENLKQGPFSSYLSDPLIGPDMAEQFEELVKGVVKTRFAAPKTVNGDREKKIALAQLNESLTNFIPGVQISDYENLERRLLSVRENWTSPILSVLFMAVSGFAKRTRHEPDRLDRLQHQNLAVLYAVRSRPELSGVLLKYSKVLPAEFQVQPVPPFDLGVLRDYLEDLLTLGLYNQDKTAPRSVTEVSRGKDAHQKDDAAYQAWIRFKESKYLPIKDFLRRMQPDAATTPVVHPGPVDARGSA